MTYVGMNFSIGKTFAILPRRVYRCFGPGCVKPSGTWVWLQWVETEAADKDANTFFGLGSVWGGSHVLCGWGSNPDLIQCGPDHCYLNPDRRRLIVAGRVVYEAPHPSDA